MSRAVRAPSRIDREFFARVTPSSFLAGGPNFHSEEELAYELGYRHQRGSVQLSLATFYNRYHGLRSLEQKSAGAPDTLVIGNGLDGESYGAEATARVRLTDAWRIRAGYTEIRVHIWPNPGSTDTSRGAGESQSPDRQLFVQSSLDLPAHLRVDGVFRYLGAIATGQVPAYAELDAKLTWQPLAALDVSVVGQNLLHDHHAEFGAPMRRAAIERGVYGMAQWHF
jgi:iron complex outermembrane receptor protein